MPSRMSHIFCKHLLALIYFNMLQLSQNELNMASSDLSGLPSSISSGDPTFPPSSPTSLMLYLSLSPSPSLFHPFLLSFLSLLFLWQDLFLCPQGWSGILHPPALASWVAGITDIHASPHLAWRTISSQLSAQEIVVGVGLTLTGQPKHQMTLRMSMWLHFLRETAFFCLCEDKSFFCWGCSSVGRFHCESES